MAPGRRRAARPVATGCCVDAPHRMAGPRTRRRPASGCWTAWVAESRAGPAGLRKAGSARGSHGHPILLPRWPPMPPRPARVATAPSKSSRSVNWSASTSPKEKPSRPPNISGFRRSCSICPPAVMLAACRRAWTSPAGARCGLLHGDGGRRGQMQRVEVSGAPPAYSGAVRGLLTTRATPKGSAAATVTARSGAVRGVRVCTLEASTARGRQGTSTSRRQPLVG